MKRLSTVRGTHVNSPLVENASEKEAKTIEVDRFGIGSCRDVVHTQ